MPVLVIFIIISFSLFIFYKTKYFRSKRPAERDWLSAKSSIALGFFVAIFGINQLTLFHSKLTYIISAIFIIIGALSVYNGIGAYKYYLPYARKEAEQLKQK